MRAQTVDVKSSTGRVLCTTVFRPGGKKLLAKGHVISDEDIRVLESEGMETIWVTELEDGEGGSPLHRSDQRGAGAAALREHHAAAAGAVRRKRQFRSFLYGR